MSGSAKVISHRLMLLAETLLTSSKKEAIAFVMNRAAF